MAAERKPIDDKLNGATPLLILAAHNATVTALRPHFNRRFPIWEGHTRDALGALVACVQQAKGNPPEIAKAVVAFLSDVVVGFSPSAFGNEFENEVAAGCVATRHGKPAKLQELGRAILAQPDHKGVSEACRSCARSPARLGYTPGCGNTDFLFVCVWLVDIQRVTCSRARGGKRH
jgi:hypothetical protein